MGSNPVRHNINGPTIPPLPSQISNNTPSTKMKLRSSNQNSIQKQNLKTPKKKLFYKPNISTATTLSTPTISEISCSTSFINPPNPPTISEISFSKSFINHPNPPSSSPPPNPSSSSPPPNSFSSSSLYNNFSSTQNPPTSTEYIMQEKNSSSRSSDVSTRIGLSIQKKRPKFKLNTKSNGEPRQFMKQKYKEKINVTFNNVFFLFFICFVF